MVTIGAVDFTGKFEVAVGEFTSSKLANYISRYQEELTVELLGVELYDLYVANSTDPEFVVLEEPLLFQTSCGKIYKSLGMKDMLLGFIYFLYTRDINTQQTIVGAVKQSNENSGVPSNVATLAWQRWNESVTSYEAIQRYICENSKDYPTFKGVEKQAIIPYF